LIEESPSPSAFWRGIEMDNRRARGPNRVCRRNPGHALRAGQYRRKRGGFSRIDALRINASWTAATGDDHRRDDGAAVAPHVLARMGEPYNTTRGAAMREDRETGGGLGLACSSPRPCWSGRRRDGRINAPPPATGAQAINRLAALRIRAGSTGAATANRKKRCARNRVKVAFPRGRE